MSEINQVTKRSSIVFAANIAHNALNLLSVLLFARLLGPEHYGSATYLIIIVDLVSVLPQFGFANGLVATIPRLMAERRSKAVQGVITFTVLFVLISSTGISLVVVLGRTFVAIQLLNKPELASDLVFVFPFLAFWALTSVYRGVFRGREKIEHFLIGNSFIFPLVRIAGFLVLFSIGFGFRALLVSTAVAKVVVFVYYRFTDRKNGESSVEGLEADKQLLVDYVLFSLPLLLNGFVNYLIGHTDIFMIGRFMSHADVGIYRVAMRIAYSTSFVLTTFNTVLVPAIGRLYNENRLEEVLKLYRTISRWVFSINLLLFSMVLVFREEMLMLFGLEYLPGKTVLLVIAAGQVLNSAVGPAGHVNVVTGHPRHALLANTVSATLNIGLNVILIPMVGLIGAGIASLVAIGVGNVIRVILLHRSSQMDPFSRGYFRALPVAVVVAFTIWAGFDVIELDWLIELTLGLPIGALFFSFLYWKICFEDADKSVLEAIKTKLRGSSTIS